MQGLSRLGRTCLRPYYCKSLGTPLSASPLPSTPLASFTPLVTSVRTNLGYIPFEGRVGRKLSNTEHFLFELRKANIQPAKKITYTFDPMREDYQSIRNFMYFWNRPKVLDTNIKVLIKTDIVDDRREPVILIELKDKRVIEVRTSKLTELEIARIVNHYLLPLVEEDEVQAETKASKAAAGGKKKGKK
jgi:hypothetical protein